MAKTETVEVEFTKQYYGYRAGIKYTVLKADGDNLIKMGVAQKAGAKPASAAAVKVTREHKAGLTRGEG